MIRRTVTRARIAILAAPVFFLISALAYGQLDKMIIPAGTPEDKDLTAITNEPARDQSKALAILATHEPAGQPQPSRRVLHVPIA